MLSGNEYKKKLFAAKVAWEYERLKSGHHAQLNANETHYSLFN